VQAVDLSVVVPVYNEVDSLERLKGWISDVLDGAGYTFEIIFADDGSTDGSRALLEDLLRTDDRVRLVKLTRNYGKAAALSEGFKIASSTRGMTSSRDGNAAAKIRGTRRFRRNGSMSSRAASAAST
jgi:glycosyltransferase involved in cell wall biosynthesis